MDLKEIKLKTAILPSGNDATVCSYCNIECSSNDDVSIFQTSFNMQLAVEHQTYHIPGKLSLCY